MKRIILFLIMAVISLNVICAVIDYTAINHQTLPVYSGSLGTPIVCDFNYVKLGESESNTDTPPALTFAVSNYPNPFNPTTTIRYTVPKDGDVLLCIYNTRGQLITTLVNEHKNLGIHSVVWNGNDSNGSKASSGIYFTRIIANGKSLTTKMLLLK